MAAPPSLEIHTLLVNGVIWFIVAHRPQPPSNSLPALDDDHDDDQHQQERHPCVSREEQEEDDDLDRIKANQGKEAQ